MGQKPSPFTERTSPTMMKVLPIILVLAVFTCLLGNVKAREDSLENTKFAIEGSQRNARDAGRNEKNMKQQSERKRRRKNRNEKRKLQQKKLKKKSKKRSQKQKKCH